ncbi:unnamed protein product [Gemmataceae bacterium]|nr:unnamed protein product [Gemmataceae bacterium]VTT96521.1 unnamed protein product [Gemmataceae bacterium]
MRFGDVMDWLSGAYSEGEIMARQRSPEMAATLKQFAIVRTDADGTVRRIAPGTEEYQVAENTIMSDPVVGPLDRLGLRLLLLATRGGCPILAAGARWHFEAAT